MLPNRNKHTGNDFFRFLQVSIALISFNASPLPLL